MEQITLSKLQQKQYKEIKDKFSGSEKVVCFSDEDVARLQDILALLEIRGYILDLEINGTNAYCKQTSFDSFESWLKDQEREDRKLSAREWRIAIISALIGLIPFIVSDVIPWITKIIEKLQQGGLLNAG